MKKLSLIRVESVKHFGVLTVLISIIEISTPTTTLEESHRMVLEEHSVDEEIDSDGITTTVLPYRYLKRHSVLELEVRDELRQNMRADRLRAGAKLHRVFGISDRDINSDLLSLSLRMIGVLVTFSFVTSSPTFVALFNVVVIVEVGTRGCEPKFAAVYGRVIFQECPPLDSRNKCPSWDFLNSTK